MTSITDKEREDSRLSQADRDFETAVRSLHLEAIPAALLGGADPNRLFTDPKRPQSGCRAIAILARPVSLGSAPLAGAHDGGFSRAHAFCMKAMVEAGADFSLPAFASRSDRFLPFDGQAGVSFSDLGINLWKGERFSIESFFWFAKAGGDVRSVFDSREFTPCPAVSSPRRTLGSAEETLGPLWETTLKPTLESHGGRLPLLTDALGFGLLEWAQWLIAKGALPASYPNGSGALAMLADQTASFSKPSQASTPSPGGQNAPANARSLADCQACARLAVSFGENPGRSGTAQEQSIFLSVFSRRYKTSPGVSLAFAQTLADLGAAFDNGVGDYPALAYALVDTDNALAQMELALRLGADPHDRPRLAAMALIRAAESDQDALVAQAIDRLADIGADLSQPRHEPRDDSLIARAAAKGLWDSVQRLAAAGCDPFWRDAQTGDTVMSLAAKRSADSGSSLGGAVVLAQWLAEQGAPIDLPGSDGMTPLHRAAKALHSELCEALLSAGAQSNAPTLDSNRSTPAHLACARFEKKREKAQLATLRALAQHGADFSILDGKNRSAMEIASKKGFLSVALSVAQSAQGAALDGPSGLRAAKTLAERGEGFLAVVEQAQLDHAVANAPATQKRRTL